MFDSWGRAVYRRRRLVLEIAAIAVALVASWSTGVSGKLQSSGGFAPPGSQSQRSSDLAAAFDRDAGDVVVLYSSPTQTVRSPAFLAAVADRLAVLAGLAALRPDDQEALRLIGWEQLDVAGAAQVMGCSAATFRVRCTGHAAGLPAFWSRLPSWAAVIRTPSPGHPPSLLERRSGMKATEAARLLRESNPVADDAFADAAHDNLGRATFERIVGSSAESAPVPVRSPRRRRLFWLAAIATGVGVVAGLLPVLRSGPPRLTRPVHTAWEPARPLPRGAVVGAGGPAGAWRLASYLVSAGWRTNTAGPEPGPLTCPTATTCYVEGDNATSASGPPDMDTMYVSYDGAVSWNALPVPAGITFTSALSCASGPSSPDLSLIHLISAQGSSSPPKLSDLACASDSTCYASGSENVFERVAGGITLRPGSTGVSPVVVITHDAGLTWSRVTLTIPAHMPPAMRADPSAFLSVGVIQCPQPGACIALGGASRGSKSTAVYTYRSTP